MKSIKEIFDIFFFRRPNDPENLNNESWKRNLLLLCAAQFIAMVGMNAVVPFLPLYVVELGIKSPDEAKLWSGLIFAGPYFLSVIAVPIWGVLGDKYGQKPMVLRAIFGLGVSVFAMGFAVNVYQLFILRILQGAVSGFIASALAFATKNSPENKSGYAIGLLQSASSAGVIIGPFIGGVIADFAGIKSVFFIVSGLCFVSGALILFYLKEKYNRNISNSPSLISNMRFVIHDKEVLKLVLLVVIAQGGIYFTNPIFPFFVKSLNAPAAYLSTITGLLLAVVGVFSILFAPFWGKRNDNKDYKKTLAVAAAASGIGILLHTTVTNYLWLFPIRGAAGVFIAAIVPTLYAALSKRSPAEARGGIMGIASSASLLGSLVSFLSCGVVASSFGMFWSFAVSGLLLFIVSASSLVRFGKLKA